MENFNSTLQKIYPNAANQIQAHDFSHLVSDEVISLPKSIKKRVQKFIAELFEISRSARYKELVENSLTDTQKKLIEVQKSQASVLMAYDFHWLPQTDELKLIEINTNASGYLLADAIYTATGIDSWGNPLESLKSSFLSEAKGKPQTVAIIDESISSQKMLVEFYLYQDLFRQWGWDAEIKNFDELRFSGTDLYDKENKKYSFIYNRYCDFDFSNKVSSELLQAYLSETVTFSPNPKEYLLLAEKTRLNLISQKCFFPSFLDGSDEEVKYLSSMLCRSFSISDFESIDELWSQRHNFFFKPKNSYGGKQAYKGSSVSRKKFEEIYNDNLFIQEFAAPPKYFSESLGQIYKYDLRFYSYGPVVQLGIARSYQGQLTNFQSPGGGFTPLKFT